MVTSAAPSPRPAARHARPRFPEVTELVSVRIPRAANAVLDWAQSDPLAAGVAVTIVATFSAGVWLAHLATILPVGAGCFLAGALTLGVWHRVITAEQRATIAQLRADNRALTTRAVAPVADDGPTTRLRSISDWEGGDS